MLKISDYIIVRARFKEAPRIDIRRKCRFHLSHDVADPNIPKKEIAILLILKTSRLPDPHYHYILNLPYCKNRFYYIGRSYSKGLFYGEHTMLAIPINLNKPLMGSPYPEDSEWKWGKYYSLLGIGEIASWIKTYKLLAVNNAN